MAGTALLAHMSVPDAYGMVEPGVYRSNGLSLQNLPFLLHLHLRTVLYLSTDPPLPYVTDFLRDNSIALPSISLVKLYYSELQRDGRLLHIGYKFEKPTVTWKPVSEDLIKDALEIVLDVNTHPIMIMCQTGVHVTGTVVGCLRRLQKWNLTSLLEEYRRYAGSKARYANEQFMELFDEDLITLPESLPPWFIDQMRMMEDEEGEFQRELEKQRCTEELQKLSTASLEDGPSDESRLQENQNGGFAAAKQKAEAGMPNVKRTAEPPNYRKFFYTQSSPLTTESRSYKRKIIGKVGS